MSTIMKNGIAYGGSADQADLILATDSNGNESSVQSELNKKLENKDIIIVLGDEIPTNATTGNYATTVSTPTGYKFLVNIGVYTSGFVSASTFNPLVQNPRVFFNTNQLGEGWCKIVTAFIKE